MTKGSYLSNFELLLLELEKDVTLADSICWESYDVKQQEQLCCVLIQNGYLLSSNSPLYLLQNEKVVFSSIQKDINSYVFAKDSIDSKKILVYLLKNHYSLPLYSLYFKNMSYLLEEDVLNYFFLERPKLQSYIIGETEEIQKDVITLFHQVLKSKPKIKDFDELFHLVAENEWDIQQEKYVERYGNLLSKMCCFLKQIETYEKIYCVFPFLYDMKEVLGEKFIILENAMKDYFLMVHKEKDSSLLVQSRDTISKMVALYKAKKKELFKKDKINSYLGVIKKYYTIREDSPIVKKKVYFQLQKEKCKELYLAEDLSIKQAIAAIIHKYSSISFVPVEGIIRDILLYGEMSYSRQLNKPIKYDAYVRYKKVMKLIHRLHSGYIKIDGLEVKNYLGYIKYDEMLEEYVYQGDSFTSEEIEKIHSYDLKKRIYDAIFKDVMLLCKRVQVDEQLLRCSYDDLRSILPFNDEHFVFDWENNLQRLAIYRFVCIFANEEVDNKNKCDLNTSCLTILHSLLIEKGLFWLLLMLGEEKNDALLEEFTKAKLDSKHFAKLFHALPSIVSLSQKLQVKINSCKDLLRFYKILAYVRPIDVALLGLERIEKLMKYLDFTKKDEEKIIQVASALVCQMYKKNYFTVPIVNGQVGNYRYSFYDCLDRDVLLSGIESSCCFKVCGNGNDFLHYCALNKNGFVLKITDLEGHFVGKVSGFRNGNVIYLNQLRTIYDFVSIGAMEKKDILATFMQAVADIVYTSQCDAYEKIDFAFANEDFLLQDLENKEVVTKEIQETIDSFPVDRMHEDWVHFVNDTNNLKEIKRVNDVFTTDFGTVPILLVASSYMYTKNISDCFIQDEEVTACYEREREQVVVAKEMNACLLEKVNRIKAVESYYRKQEFVPISLDRNVFAFVGDDWYILWDGENVVASCLLGFDARGVQEYESTLEKIEKKNIISCIENDEKKLNLKNK